MQTVHQHKRRLAGRSDDKTKRKVFLQQTVIFSFCKTNKTLVIAKKKTLPMNKEGCQIVPLLQTEKGRVIKKSDRDNQYQTSEKKTCYEIDRFVYNAQKRIQTYILTTTLARRHDRLLYSTKNK